MTTTATKVTAYRAAQKIAKALNVYYQIDIPVNQAVALGRERARNTGYYPGGQEAAVVLEGEYEWPIEFTGGDLGPTMTALWQELRDAGIFMEPDSGWMLNIYYDRD